MCFNQFRPGSSLTLEVLCSSLVLCAFNIGFRVLQSNVSHRPVLLNGSGSRSVFRSSFDVILIDVGGLSSDSGLMEALSLIRQLSHAFRPRLRAIVIKSACVRSFCGEMQPSTAYIDAIESRAQARIEAESF